ncbi:MAG: hypothetical protein AB1625_15650 [Acidobacteriota bacterium]
MDTKAARSLLEGILRETVGGGMAAVDRFPGLRDVDAKVREVRTILSSMPGLPGSLLADFDKDGDFQANSRRVRLEALANYCRSAIKLIDSGATARPQIQLSRAPDLVKLTSQMPGLDEVINRRWREAQICQHAKAHLSAVVLMGSVLEALLLARALLAPSEAYRASHAPREKSGKNLAITEWNLNALIDVAVEIGWLKADRGKFSHALRESRNVVHPWVEVTSKANFDDSTCKTCWEVLLASVNDLLRSI